MTVNRDLVEEFNFLKTKYPVLALTGPRQSGKTTLLKTVFKNYTYVSLEDPDIRRLATNDTRGFFTTYKENVIIDEAQRVPEIFSYIQTIVDDSGKMGQFILSGSQNFHLMKNITQSLAGRVALLKLFPFDFNELKNAKLLPKNYTDIIIKGFYPAIFDRDIPSATFYSNYIQTYIERDIVDLINVHDTKQFRLFLKYCAGRASQVLNLSTLATECGISQPTAKAWLSVLESSYIVFQLQPYFQNYNKRIIKSPKLYFYDTSLLAHLLGIKHKDKLPLHTYKGALFENMIVAEYHKQKYHKNNLNEYWYWRDSNKNEVDLLQQSDDGFSAIEIKTSSTINADFFDNLDYLGKLAGSSLDYKKIVYGGNTAQIRTNYTVNPWNIIN